MSEAENINSMLVRRIAQCCSVSWIENIELPAMGLPATVLAYQNRELEREHPEDFDVDVDNVTKFYGCAIKTDKGDIDIDYRNTSNGYYGGNLCWHDKYFEGGVHDQNVSNERWQLLASSADTPQKGE